MIGTLKRRKFSLPLPGHLSGSSSSLHEFLAMSGKGALRLNLSEQGGKRRPSGGVYPGSPAESSANSTKSPRPSPPHAAASDGHSGATSPFSNFITPISSRFNVGKGKAKAKDKKKTSKSSSSTSTSPILQEHHICPGDINVEVLREWETSFNSLLKHPDGVELFEGFLKSEFSEENIQFWKACERYKTVPDHMVEKEAAIVYEEFVAPQAPKLVNIDHQTSREIVENMRAPDRATFTRAQQSIYLLMARDSFVRFIKSEQFQQALKRSQ